MSRLSWDVSQLRFYDNLEEQYTSWLAAKLRYKQSDIYPIQENSQLAFLKGKIIKKSIAEITWISTKCMTLLIKPS